MKALLKISPLVISLSCLSQTDKEKVNPRIEFGFTSATFCGLSAANPLLERMSGTDVRRQNITVCSMPSANFGWKQGLFFWVNLTSYLAYKAEADFVYSVNTHVDQRNFSPQYSTSCGYELKPQLIIRPVKTDRAPIIKMAKSMSYYLSGKQPYIIIGPKFGYYQCDRQFRRVNDARHYTIGCVAGVGADNMFHNMDFAPEVTISIEYQTGNAHLTPNASNRYYISAAVAINLF